MKKVLFILLAFVSISFADKKETITLSNFLRLGHDDNIYQRENNTVETIYISDIINLSSKILFSNRAELLLYWQPEIRYRFDAQEKELFFQDLYASYQNALSKSSQISIIDRYRYSEIDANQSGNDASAYAENNLTASYVRQISEKNGINLSVGSTSRRNDDDSSLYNRTLDFDRYLLSGLITRNLDAAKRSVSIGYQYSNHAVKNSGGGIKSGTLFLGYDRIFNPEFIGSIQLGYTDAEIEQKFGSADLSLISDSSNPFFEVGFNYQISKRTRLSSSYSHSLRHSTSSAYNAEQRSDWLIALSRDITAKINFGISYSYVRALYESDYLRDTTIDFGRQDKSQILNVRAEYKIDKNHYLEMGYQGRSRDSEISSNGSYDRNRIYFGWKLEL